MTIWVGPPGALVALPSMGRSIDASLDLAAVTHRAVNGVQTVDYVGLPKRTYRMTREQLTAAEMSVLEELALGMRGAEPYYLIEPWRENVLSIQQSSSGEQTRDTTGFHLLNLVGTNSIVGPGSQAPRGRYNLQHLSGASGAAGTRGVSLVNVGSAANVIATGIPCVPSTAYTFRALVKHIAGTAASWRATLAFYDAAGVIIGTATNGTAAVVTGSYVERVVTATSPANAAYVAPQITNNATLAATNTLHLGDFALGAHSSAQPFMLGTGTPKVAFTSLGDTYPWLPLHNASVELVEVG